MKICDVTQFYSPLSGGVKRYVHEKINYIQNAADGDSHVLIIPGEKTEVIEDRRSRIYSIHSPLAFAHIALPHPVQSARDRKRVRARAAGYH